MYDKIYKKERKSDIVSEEELRFLELKAGRTVPKEQRDRERPAYERQKQLRVKLSNARKLRNDKYNVGLLINAIVKRVAAGADGGDPSAFDLLARFPRKTLIEVLKHIEKHWERTMDTAIADHAIRVHLTVTEEAWERLKKSRWFKDSDFVKKWG